MAYDIVAYNNNNEKVGRIEISEDLHFHLFHESKFWTKYRSLKKIKDYNKANAKFISVDLQNLIDFLTEVEQNSSKFGSDIKVVRAFLENSQVHMVHVRGE